MSKPKTLGDMVAQDRRAADLTQEALAMKIAPGRSTEARTWLAKLERNSLKKEIGKTRRTRLARTLKVSVKTYLEAPIQIRDGWDNDEFDVLPIVLYLAEKKPLRVSFGKFRLLCQAAERCREIGVSFPEPDLTLE